MVKLVLLNAFVCFSDLFSFDQNHLTLVFKGMFFAVLKFACYNINPAILQREELAEASSAQTQQIHPSWHARHLQHISSVLGPCAEGKIQAAKLQILPFCDNVFICAKSSMFLVSWAFPVGVWRGSFLAQFEMHFLHLCTKKYSQPLHPLCWFSRQNQKYWMLGEVQHEHNVLTTHPGSSQDPATSHPFPAQIQNQCLSSEVMLLWEETRRAEVGILWSVFWSSLLSELGTVCVWFVVECQGRETSSSFPGALSCPLRLLASVVFPSRKLLWKTSPWSCRKTQSSDSWFVANKFLFSVEVKPLDFAKIPFSVDQKKAKHHFSLAFVPCVFGNSVII